jgi:peptidyl-prolyl cis-trans isomerase B (cyclophilin B)|tara:strand:- start:1931 stop:2569 length:639 start_codon:yes stop_codon:yes gene_type:complete
MLNLRLNRFGKSLLVTTLIFFTLGATQIAASQPKTQPQKGTASMSKNPRVNLKTNMGDIVIELNAEKAPKSAENFLMYAREGAYNNTIFHRVMDGFMVQGGGFEPGMKQKPTHAPIDNEAANGLKNDKYTVAMARTNDPHSATSQFFINVANNEFLNFTAPSGNGWGYAVFGKVVQGEDVVDKIRAVKTGNAGPHQNVPSTDVVIEQVTIIE